MAKDCGSQKASAVRSHRRAPARLLWPNGRGVVGHDGALSLLDMKYWRFFLCVKWFTLAGRPNKLMELMRYQVRCAVRSVTLKGRRVMARMFASWVPGYAAVAEW